MQFGCLASGAQQHPSVAAARAGACCRGENPVPFPKKEDVAAPQPFCFHPSPRSQGCPTEDWFSMDFSTLALKIDEKVLKESSVFMHSWCLHVGPFGKVLCFGLQSLELFLGVGGERQTLPESDSNFWWADLPTRCLTSPSKDMWGDHIAVPTRWDKPISLKLLPSPSKTGSGFVSFSPNSVKQEHPCTSCSEVSYKKVFCMKSGKTLPVSDMLWPKLRDLKPKEMLTSRCLKWSCYWSPCRRDSILMLDHDHFLVMYLLHLSLTSAGRGNVFRSTAWELHVN